MVRMLSEISAWYTLVEFLLGMIMMCLVVKRGKYFWPLVIIGSIFGQGPRFLGYHFLDEFFTGCIVVGAIVRIVTCDVKQTIHARPSQRKLIFFIWIGYMILESIVGIYVNEDLRIVRWVLLYALLALITFITDRYNDEFPFPPIKTILQIILWATFFYLIIYLAVGCIYDIIMESYAGRWHSQFMRQGFIWSGTGCAVFPKVLAFIACIMVIGKDYSYKLKILACFVLLLMGYSGLYYDSRMSYVVLVGGVVTSIHKMKLGTIFAVALTLSIAFVVYMDTPGQTISKFFSNLFYGTQSLWIQDDEKNTDLNRKLQLQAGILRLGDSLKTSLIGDGVYSHRFTVIPHIERLYSIYLPEAQFKKPSGTEQIEDDEHEDNWGSLSIFRTTGFTAMLVDSGFIGMLLFFSNFLMVGIILYNQRSEYLSLLLFSLLLSFCWLFVVNILDVMMLYLFIIPGGILERMSLSTTKRQVQTI